MLHHEESTEGQYALLSIALELGWSDPQARMTGTEMTRGRTSRLWSRMCSMGAVFALEVSRLARSNLDWHRLELCASWLRPRICRGVAWHAPTTQ